MVPPVTARRTASLLRLTLLTGTLLLTSPALAQPPRLLAAWAPLIILAGDGDPANAVREIEAMMAAVDAAVRGLDADQRTLEFADDVRSNLRAFDLKDLYRALPDTEPTLNWRRLTIAGRVVDHGYRLEQYHPFPGWTTAVASLGVHRTESAALIRARPLEVDRQQHFLIDSRGALTLGRMEWRNVIDAIAELLLTPLRYVSAGSSETAGIAAPVDAALRVFTEGFPHLSRQLSTFGTLERVEMQTGPQRDWYCIDARWLADIDGLEQRYEDLADFLDDLDELANIRLQWLDNRGRTLYDTTIDTRKPSVDVRFCSRDGVLLPFSGQTVFHDEPVDPWGPDLASTRTIVDAHFKVLGLKIDILRLPIELQYQPTRQRVQARLVAKELPEIGVSGYALGFISPKVIDLFIPGNIQSIAYDFARSMVRGDQGRGVVTQAGFGPRHPDRFAVLDVGMRTEILNNFMVKFAARAALKRFLPDDDARQDLARMFADAREAFRQDLADFANATAFADRR